MSTVLIVAVCIATFAAVILIVDAAVGFFRAARGHDEEAVSRRLFEKSVLDEESDAPVELLRARNERTILSDLLGPFYSQFEKYMNQAKLGISAPRMLGFMMTLTLGAFLALALVLPEQIKWTSALFAPVIGFGGPFAFVMRARNKRKMAFEEQLPDALDLIVRSLRIGHPVSGAVSVIAREMPAPIGPEFAIVASQVAYGQELPAAILQMQERVPAPDLSYFSMALQIQQEAGGNLVESLQKLAAVVRDRYRMFRKVHAVTAEGRFSAWALSLFPFIIAFGLTMVRPDYFNVVAKEPWFPIIATLVVVMLIVNIIMMRVLTTIKV